MTEYVAKPFRFEDLNGKPEPDSWGPAYPKTASASVEKWRMTARGRALSADEKRAYGQAVGEWIRALNSIKPAPRVSLDYKMPDYRAKCRAEFAAQAGRDRLAWALGKKNYAGETIAQAYAKAMREKRKALAEPMREAAWMFYRFIFRNLDTGETREAVAPALNPAARALGLPFEANGDGRQSLAAPWSPWECWNALGECVWHCDEHGCWEGPRHGS